MKLPCKEDKKPPETFERHTNGKKHRDTILNKQKLKKIKIKGNTICQMTTSANNSVKEN